MKFSNKKLADYEYLERLGEGAQGKVVKVRHRSRRVYALKLFNDSLGDSIKKEIEALQQFDHHNIVRVYDSDFADHEPYMLMEYMKYGNIKEYVKKNDLNIEEKLLLIQDVACALEYVHKQGFIHRDIKPNNIFIADDGEGAYACLGDFGLVKKIDITTDLSETGGGKGTRIYLPFELFSEEKQHSHSKRSDIYGLGMSMYELLAGKHPCETQLKYIQSLSNNIPFSKPSTYNSSLNNEIDEFCLKSIAIKEEERFDNIAEFNEQLQRCIDLYLDNESSRSGRRVDMDKNDEGGLLLEVVEIDNLTIRDYKSKNRDKNKYESNIVNEGLFEKGNDYFFGQNGLEQDYIRAREYYEQAGKQGHAMALYKLGTLYEKGYYGTKKSYGKAIHFYRVAGVKGLVEALYHLGTLYEEKHEYKQAMEYYEQAAKEGCVEGLYKMGIFYNVGRGVNQDYKKAKEYYEKAGRKKHAEALFNLGLLYNSNCDVGRDYTKAKEYWELAVKEGHIGALVVLGDLYYNGVADYGVKQDYKKAKKYYDQVGELGHAGVFYKLGLLYEKGFGVKKNYCKAKEYYEKAADKGDIAALYKLGLFYAMSYGVEQNFGKAKKYWEQAGEKGYTKALTQLGYLYENGYCGVEQNYSKARNYYERTLGQNNSQALCNLGKLYENGHGVMKNYLKARECYERASLKRNAQAIYHYGALYENGLGVDQDYNIAKECYKKAAEMGSEDAQKKLEILKNKT